MIPHAACSRVGMSGAIRAASALFSVLLLAGCGPSEAGQGTTFSDSAGVILAIAEAPAWGSGEGWHVSDEPMVEIGVLEGSQEYILSDVSGAVRLGDGRIVIADRGSLDLRFYSPTGEFLFRSGREGEGPGEFRSLEFLGVLPGDSLLTFDWRLTRIQLFDPSGTFLRSARVESSWPMFYPTGVIGVLDERRIAMMFLGLGTGVPTGASRWPPEMAVALDLATGAADSIVVVPGQEASVTPREGGGFGYYYLPFGIKNGFAARAGRVAVISTDTIGARVYFASGGLERIIRHPVSARPVTQEDFEGFVETFIRSQLPEGSGAPAEQVAALRRILEENPRGDTWPQLSSVDFDAEGNLWLERFSKFGDPRAPYDVFSPEGVWLGQVTLPPGRQRCFQFGEDFVLGVWKDQLEVPYVRMYSLEK